MLVLSNQNGFIPRQSIFDSIHLAHTMDLMEEDGTIIALDQKKAFDRI